MWENKDFSKDDARIWKDGFQVIMFKIFAFLVSFLQEKNRFEKDVLLKKKVK